MFIYCVAKQIEQLGCNYRTEKIENTCYFEKVSERFEVICNIKGIEIPNPYTQHKICSNLNSLRLINTDDVFGKFLRIDLGYGLSPEDIFYHLREEDFAD